MCKNLPYSMLRSKRTKVMDRKHVINLQKAVGTNADGIMGRMTLEALFVKLGATKIRAQQLALAGLVRMNAAGILDNPLRFAHFIAQLAHESGNFRYMEEIASGAAYEGRKDLGNVNKGDGIRFKGRGPIQLTGRTNYDRASKAIGLDLVASPEIAARPDVGMWTACWFWDVNGLNKWADNDDVDTVTRRINGGTNGLADRKAKLKTVRTMLGV